MVPTCCTTVGEPFSFWGHIHDRHRQAIQAIEFAFFFQPPETLSGLGTEQFNLRAVQFLTRAIFACIMSQKEEHLVPSWDGEISGWADYSRKVRLFHSQTPVSKRYTLGPKLVLRLRGKAWEVAASLDHDELSKPIVEPTSASMARTLDLSCPGDHEHDACLGHDRTRHEFSI